MLVGQCRVQEHEVTGHLRLKIAIPTLRMRKHETRQTTAFTVVIIMSKAAPPKCIDPQHQHVLTGPMTGHGLVVEEASPPAAYPAGSRHTLAAAVSWHDDRRQAHAHVKGSPQPLGNRHSTLQNQSEVNFNLAIKAEVHGMCTSRRPACGTTVLCKISGGMGAPGGEGGRRGERATWGSACCAAHRDAPGHNTLHSVLEF